jgi:predicted PurR-regulated permease PerM
MPEEPTVQEPPTPAAETPIQEYGVPGAPLRSSRFVFGLTAGAGVLVALLVVAGVHRAVGVIGMLVAATFIALGLDRPVAALMRRGLRRPMAVAVVDAVVVLLACGLVALVVPPLAGQLTSFLGNIPDIINKITQSEAFRRLNENTNLSASATKALTPTHLASLAGGVLGGVLTVVSLLFTIITTGLLSLFILAGLENIRRGSHRLVVASRRDRVGRLSTAIQLKVGAYLVGAITIAAVAGTLAFIWCLSVGVPYPLVMATIVAFFDLIPQIGATIGSTIVILVSLTVSVPLALASLGFFCAYQALENWLIYPRLMSRAVKITNLGAIVCALVGFALLGVLGVLLAVPAYASAQLVVREVVFPRQDAR